MTRTIDIPTYQTAVVRNCSPTLAGIKPASLFTYPGVYANQNGKPSAAHIEERRSRLLAVITQCNRELQPLGIHMSVLVWRPCGALIYVYRPADLMRYLSDPRATTALAAEGYDASSPMKLAIFLGYPYEDVHQFIVQHGENYKVFGAWKVYTNVEQALTTFDSYRACTQYLTYIYQQGCTLGQLVQATR